MTQDRPGGAGRMPPWWALLPPADARVPCGDGTHRLHWADGRLAAADHPDAEGELVLAALGGERPECIGLLESWGGRGDDLQVLAVGPRSAADELTLGPDDLAEPQQMLGIAGVWTGRGGHRSLLRAGRWPRRRRALARMPRSMATFGGGPRTTPMQSATSFSRLSYSRPGPHPWRQVRTEQDREEARRLELFRLLALGPEFQLRLSGTVAAAWADGGSRESDRAAHAPALVAALAGRLAPAATSWLGVDQDRVEVTLHEDAGWGELATTGTDSQRVLRAALPAGWLASVWAAGLAVVAGHLIVAVQEAAWPAATVLGVREPGADPVILEVRAADGGWAAAHQDGMR
jgi:hypothetical protein